MSVGPPESFLAVLSAAARSGDVATLAQLVKHPGLDVNALLDGDGYRLDDVRRYLVALGKVDGLDR